MLASMQGHLCLQRDCQNWKIVNIGMLGRYPAGSKSQYSSLAICPELSTLIEEQDVLGKAIYFRRVLAL